MFKGQKNTGRPGHISTIRFTCFLLQMKDLVKSTLKVKLLKHLVKFTLMTLI